MATSTTTVKGDSHGALAAVETSTSTCTSLRQSLQVLKGVVFGKSIRSRYAILHTAVDETTMSALNACNDGNDNNNNNNNMQNNKRNIKWKHVVVHVDLCDAENGLSEGDSITQLRSWCRRSYKLGDLIEAFGQWTRGTEKTQGFLVKVGSLNEASNLLSVAQVRHWSMTHCQEWQRKHRPRRQEGRAGNECSSTKTATDKEHQRKKRVESDNDEDDSDKKRHQEKKEEAQAASSVPSSQRRHCAGNKREQGECVANFLIDVIMTHHQLPSSSSSSSSSSIQSKHQLANSSSSSGKNDDSNDTLVDHAVDLLRKAAVDSLNRGSGVMDAAGGSGHVSMALGMRGVKSTVVDPRESVGKLPRRDRRVWNRLLRRGGGGGGGGSGDDARKTVETSQAINSGGGGASGEEDEQSLVCKQVAVVPFDSLRAWFAQPPPQHVDTSFRHGDVDRIPVCDDKHDLLVNSSAMVALHPDEATDAIVDTAVKLQIPFVVVPCCVFSRLFPNRQKPGTDLPVTTYDDLLEYLAAKHDTIRRTTLPFEGANVALWSVFEPRDKPAYISIV